ncbi:hypothetical protein D0Z07_4880 [Hyphodiscus hymeniophilus]|uniref:Low temperature requirement A n=1 Tax=Hyphodiscus hymeniophilus TaxID=353542 RepID=A0A9P6VJB1_9HELO|nr:hypothetical protein D0Z07_4880 [Hyphodiscus hymeniophilus]
MISPVTTRSRNSISSRRSSNTENDAEERSSDNIPKVRSRLDLFVDLIWVGIIANLSGNFETQAYEENGTGVGTALAVFILLFIPIWRVWDNLRLYTSSFFIDDIVQRNFTLWILVLAVLYGINAPYAYEPNGGKTSLTLLIILYIISKASFVGAYGLQTIFLPFLRKQFWFQVGTSLVIIGIWVGAIFVPYPHKIILLVFANAVEHPVQVFLASPTSDRLLAENMKKSPDIDHYVDRHEGFFIIILGEGVFRLIEGSPSGMGLNSQTGTVLTALLIYYILHWLYFNGDQSKEYVHALRRTWWKPVLWQMFHVTMFGALLGLDASIIFLVKNLRSDLTATIQEREVNPANPDVADLARLIHRALWGASGSLGLTIFSMTSIALLNRSLDVMIICLPLIPGMTGATWCAAAVALLYGVFLWEWFGGLERDWKVFEPKSE